MSDSSHQPRRPKLPQIRARLADKYGDDPRAYERVRRYVEARIYAWAARKKQERHR